MKLKDEVVAELSTLIEEAQRLEQSFRLSSQGTYESSIKEHEHRALLTSARAAVARIAGSESEYFRSIRTPRDKERISVTGWSSTIIPAALGSLLALRNAVEAGSLNSIERRLRSAIHDDLLEQAEELLSSGYYVAAMVLTGCVLENHLRRLCNSRGLAWKGSGSISKYNDLLRDIAYTQSTWRRIQSVGDSRNDAAHGNGNAVSPGEVEEAIPFVRRIIDDHPA